MRIISRATTEGVLEQLFELEVRDQPVPGVIWSSRYAAATQAIILMGHGGGLHKKFPGITMSAQRYVSSMGFTVVAIDAPGHGDREPSKEDAEFVKQMRSGSMQGEELLQLVAQQNERLASIAVPEWQATLDAVQALDPTAGSAPVGYLGLALGGAIGVHLIASESRIRAAIVGLVGLRSADQGLAQAAARVTIPLKYVMQWDDELVPRPAALELFDAFGSRRKTLHANTGRHAEVPQFERASWESFFYQHLLEKG